MVAEGQGGPRLASQAGAMDGWLEVDVVDLSHGGMGLISLVFLPRRTLLTVRVFSPQGDGAEILQCPVRIQRVCMTDRRPAYLLGTSFEQMSPERRSKLDELLESIGGSTPA